jgi:hypothetical protein
MLTPKKKKKKRGGMWRTTERQRTGSGVRRTGTVAVARCTGTGACSTDVCTRACGSGAVRKARAQVRLGVLSARFGAQISQRRKLALHLDVVVNTECIASAQSLARGSRGTYTQVGAVSAGTAATRKTREKEAKRMVEVVKREDERGVRMKSEDRNLSGSMRRRMRGSVRREDERTWPYIPVFTLINADRRTCSARTVLPACLPGHSIFGTS